MSDTTKKYLDWPGLQEYDKGVKNALNQKVNEKDLLTKIKKGQAGGVAELNDNGKVPSSQLPSYVDDIVEGYYKEDIGEFWQDKTTTASKYTGETGKIYVDLDTNKTYRWSGTVYVEVGSAEIPEIPEATTSTLGGVKMGTAQDIEQQKQGIYVPTCKDVYDFVTGYVEDFGEDVLKSIGSNTHGVFIGTTAEYETANSAGEIPVGTVVIITDDEGSEGSSIDLSALLQQSY